MHEHMCEVLSSSYAAITGIVDGLEESDLRRPTRTDAWTVGDLLWHMGLDPARALAALASPTADQPDVDAVTYWRGFRPDQGDGGAAHARLVQTCAAAFASADALTSWWKLFAAPAARSALAAPAQRQVQTQGHVIAVPDLVSTLIVEATVHHLDLTVDLPDAAPTPSAGLAETRRVLSGLLGAALPTRWDDVEAVLKGTGRLPLTDLDRGDLGDHASSFPLLG